MIAREGVLLLLLLGRARPFSSGAPAFYGDRLRHCKSLDECQSVHDEITASGLATLADPGNLLVQAYARLGGIDGAATVFSNLRERSSLSWGIMFSAFAQSGHLREALQLFYKLGARPDLLTFTMAFGACSRVGSLPEARDLLARFSSSGLRPDLRARNALIHMFAQCGSLDDARRVFDGMDHRNIVSWNTIFAAYGNAGDFGEVLRLLREFDLSGCVADSVTYLAIIKGCSSLRRGKEIHARALSLGFLNSTSLQTALQHMYARCGSLRDARAIFDATRPKDLVSFNVMIGAYAQAATSSGGLKAVALFRELDSEGFSPSTVTFVALLTACASLEDLSLGREVHARVISSGGRRNFILDNALLNMYARCGSLHDAKKVFDSIQEKDVSSWNAMVAAYALHGRHREAISVFYAMDVEPNSVTFTNAISTCSMLEDLAEARKLHSRIQSHLIKLELGAENSLVKMYASCGSLADAERSFERISSKDDASSWNSLMAAYIQQDDCRGALALAKRMDLEGTKLDSVTFVHLITATAGSSGCSIDAAAQIHARLLERSWQPEAMLVMSNALINMYARTGSLGRAARVFDEMPVKNDASWNAITAAYAQHGYGARALQLYHGMELHGEVPCGITLTVVLLACNHAGFQKEAWYHFTHTSQDYGVELGRVHYHCMLDVLARQGLLEEACHLLSTMPCDAGVVGWRGVLGACKIHGDDELGALATKLPHFAEES